MAKIRHVRALSRPGVVWARHLSSGAGHGAQASYSTCSDGGWCRASPGGGETGPGVHHVASNRLKMAKIRHVRGRSRPGVIWARHPSFAAEHGAQASYVPCSVGGSCRSSLRGGETAPSVRYIWFRPAELKMVKIHLPMMIVNIFLLQEHDGGEDGERISKQVSNPPRGCRKVHSAQPKD